MDHNVPVITDPDVPLSNLPAQHGRNFNLRLRQDSHQITPHGVVMEFPSSKSVKHKNNTKLSGPLAYEYSSISSDTNPKHQPPLQPSSAREAANYMGSLKGSTRQTSPRIIAMNLTPVNSLHPEKDGTQLPADIQMSATKPGNSDLSGHHQQRKAPPISNRVPKLSSLQSRPIANNEYFTMKNNCPGKKVSLPMSTSIIITDAIPSKSPQQRFVAQSKNETQENITQTEPTVQWSNQVSPPNV